MGVRSLLPPWIRSFARVLYKSSHLAERPVRLDWERSHASPRVVRDEEGSTGSVNGQVAGSSPSRRPLLRLGQLTRLGIDLEGRDRSRRLSLEIRDLIHGKQMLPPRMEGKKGGLRGLGGQFGRFQHPCRRIELAHVDTAAALAGIGTEVNAQGSSG